MLLNTIRQAGHKVFLHFHDAGVFKEEEHPRAPSGKFTKGVGAAKKPTAAKGATVVNPVAKVLKEHGYVKQKGTGSTNLYQHPPSGHEVEVHAASEGQQWLTGWTHSHTGQTGSGAGKLAKHLSSINHNQTPTVAQKPEPQSLYEPQSTITPSAASHPSYKVHAAMSDMGFAPTSDDDLSVTYSHPTKGSVSLKKLIPASGKNKGRVLWKYTPPGAKNPVDTGYGINNGALSFAISKYGSQTPAQIPAQTPTAAAAPVTKPSWAANYQHEQVTWSPPGWPAGEADRYRLGPDNDPVESIIISKTGQWKLWTKADGTVAEGTGQQSLNEAFEKLHPRGAGGKFIAKPGFEVSKEDISYHFAYGQGFKQESATSTKFTNDLYLVKSKESDRFEIINEEGIPQASGSTQQELDNAIKKFKLGGDTTTEPAAIVGGYTIPKIAGVKVDEPKQMLSGNYWIGLNGPQGLNTLVLTANGNWSLWKGSPGNGESLAQGAKQSELNVELQHQYGGATSAIPKPATVSQLDHDKLVAAGYKPLGTAPWGNKIEVYGKDDGSILLSKSLPNDMKASIFPPHETVLQNEGDTFAQMFSSTVQSGVPPIPKQGSVSELENTPVVSVPSPSTMLALYDPLKNSGFNAVVSPSDSSVTGVLKDDPNGIKAAFLTDPNKGEGSFAWQLPGENGQNEVFTGSPFDIATKIGKKWEEIKASFSSGDKAEHWTQGSLVPKTLNGVAFAPWTPPADWSKVEGQNEHLQEPQMDAKGKKPSAGLLIEEPDGRVWIVKPKNEFGGVKYTFPKGGQEPGQSLQATAIKEAFEETGLKAEITGFAGDYLGSTSMTRYYLAKRTGGTPTGHDGQESDQVSLIPRSELGKYLHQPRDLQIMKDHLIPKAIGRPIHLDSMKKIGEKKGSNPGGVYQSESGKKYYVKLPQSELHTKNELLAADLMSKAGGGTLKYHPIIDKDGKLNVGTEWEELQKNNVKQLTPAEKKKAQKDFAINAWLANWDAAGTGGDNTGILNGKAVTLDVGGALLFRAKGEPKGAAFTDIPNEWNSLRDKVKNPDAYALYGDMTPQEMKESAEKLKNITNQDIKDAVDAHFDPTDPVALDLIAKLQYRRDKILGYASVISTPTPPSAAAAKASYTPPPSKPSPNSSTISGVAIDPGTLRNRVAAWSPPGKPTYSVSAYKGSTYHEMNAWLRYGELEDSDQSASANHIREVTAWLDKASTQEPITIWRGVPNDVAKQWDKFAKEGRAIRDGGFQSCSTSKQFSDGWHGGKGRTLKINIPAGSKAATVRGPNESDSEQEIVLQRGTVLRINNWGQGGVYEVTVEPTLSKMQKAA